VHLVGFIIRIYHDSRSPECQTFLALKRSFQIIFQPHIHATTLFGTVMCNKCCYLAIRYEICLSVLVLPCQYRRIFRCIWMVHSATVHNY